MPGLNHAHGTVATAAALLLAMAAIAPAPAAAQFAVPDQTGMSTAGAPNLTQRGIPAEATAENGVLARERALASGRRLAWEKLAAEAGAPAGNLSDSRIEGMVSSIVIEQERTSPTRYAGRITVNFDANRVRSALGSRGGTIAGGGGGGASGEPATAGALPAIAAPQGPPASNWVEAVATYRSLGEWLELRRRLSGAAPVASVDVVGIAVDAARLRIGLRTAAPAAAGALAAAGIALAPVRS
ncbi:MAG: hypothetical protein ICV73_09100, partial [Acetobacteraceae bacterium]|nr:hypothetical protein [Acetobacteraceae bacterium]